VRVVHLDGVRVDPDSAALSIDDPAVRWGEGLFETMRAEGGRVHLEGLHLERLFASATTLGLAPMPGITRMRDAIDAALSDAGPGSHRVRLTASPHPTLLVEVTPEEPVPAEPPPVTATSAAGAWHPGLRIAEHKTLSYAGHRWSQRGAEAHGADHALLLDGAGRLGEAALASAFCVVDGALVTAPARGLLAGVARAAVLDALGGREEALAEEAWRAASEIVITNALRGAMAVVAVDGRPVGDGGAGPWARRVHAALRRALGAERP
jgi:branched-chain amino acid aminotransferase